MLPFTKVWALWGKINTKIQSINTSCGFFLFVNRKIKFNFTITPTNKCLHVLWHICDTDICCEEWYIQILVWCHCGQSAAGISPPPQLWSTFLCTLLVTFLRPLFKPDIFWSNEVLDTLSTRIPHVSVLPSPVRHQCCSPSSACCHPGVWEASSLVEQCHWQARHEEDSRTSDTTSVFCSSF